MPRRLRRAVVVSVLAGLLGFAVAALLAPARPTAFDPVDMTILALNASDEVERTDAAGCGVERWAIKTMVDRQAALVKTTTTRTSIAALRRRLAPSNLGTTRIAPVEFHSYRVRARLVAFKLEADSDIHLVIADPNTGGTMIAEFPLLACVDHGLPTVRGKISAARAALIRTCGQPSSSTFTALSGTASLTGVGFFDFKHGQNGVAPNAIELHPALSFSGSCSTSTRPPTTTTTRTTPPPHGRCAASYPDECIPPPPPDLDCSDIPYRNFRVLWNVPDPDPHHFDGNHDGIGCEN
jgi:hypothetical protein